MMQIVEVVILVILTFSTLTSWACCLLVRSYMIKVAYSQNVLVLVPSSKKITILNFFTLGIKIREG